MKKMEKDKWFLRITIVNQYLFITIYSNSYAVIKFIKNDIRKFKKK